MTEVNTLTVVLSGLYNADLYAVFEHSEKTLLLVVPKVYIRETFEKIFIVSKCSDRGR